MSADPGSRPDIVVWCNHGIRKGPEDFVQRFRWRDDAWILKDTAGEKQTTIGGPEGPFATAEDIANAPVGRQHLNTRCNICYRKVPMEWHRAQITLTTLLVSAETTFARLGLEAQDAEIPLRFSLQELRDAYGSTPRMS